MSTEDVASSGVQVRRIYDARAADDGVRVLVDRLWPRGLAKTDADVDDWAKDVAPSDELRRWYGHEPDRFPEFRRRYLAELDLPAGRAALDRLRARNGTAPLTLLTATKDVGHSQAVVLAELLARPAVPASRPVEEGGDPACWLPRVCPDCGRLADEDPPTRCAACGAAIDDD